MFLCCCWKQDCAHPPGVVQRRPSESLRGCRCLQAVAQSQLCSAVIWVPCRLVGVGTGESSSRPSLKDCSHLLQRLHEVGAAPSPEGLSQLMQLMEACYALTRTWRVRLPALAGEYMLLARCSCCPVASAPLLAVTCFRDNLSKCLLSTRLCVQAASTASLLCQNSSPKTALSHVELSPCCSLLSWPACCWRLCKPLQHSASAPASTSWRLSAA